MLKTNVLIRYVIAILLPIQLFAGGFRLPNQDALATARGNAYTASVDTPAAVYYNPAALSLVDGTEVSAGVYIIKQKIDFENAGVNASTDNSWEMIPHFYYKTSISNSLSAGLGFYTPFGMGNIWGENTPFAQISTEASIANNTLSPVIAYKFNECFSIGGGLTLNYIESELKFLTTLGGGAIGPEFKFKGDDLDLGYVFSLLFQPNERHSFGLLYRSHVDHELKGYSVVAGTPRLGTKGELDVPDYIDIGYSYSPTPNWNIEFNIEWINYDRINTIVLDNGTGALIPLPFNWESQFIYIIGASYYHDDYIFSIGYDFNENAMPDTFYNPSVGDADRNWLNFGVSKVNDGFDWHFAYQYGFSDRTVSNPGGAFALTNGNYDADIHAFVLSFDFKF